MAVWWWLKHRCKCDIVDACMRLYVFVCHIENMPPFYRRNLLDMTASIFPFISHKVLNMFQDLALVITLSLFDTSILMTVATFLKIFFWWTSQHHTLVITLSLSTFLRILLLVLYFAPSFFYYLPFTAVAFCWNWLLLIKTAPYMFLKYWIIKLMFL